MAVCGHRPEPEGLLKPCPNGCKCAAEVLADQAAELENARENDQERDE